jgi:hypothetical protein
MEAVKVESGNFGRSWRARYWGLTRPGEAERTALREAASRVQKMLEGRRRLGRRACGGFQAVREPADVRNGNIGIFEGAGLEVSGIPTAPSFAQCGAVKSLEAFKGVSFG